MQKEVQSDKAPKAIGPYSQAIVANGFVFASGQIAIDPQTGNLVKGNTEEQTRLVLTNLKNVIEEAGSSMAGVVKCTVFLDDLDNYARMNAVYAEFFKSPYPARAAVQVTRLPRDVQIEIEAVAVL
ncbi:MAG: RidA family protein [Candidatus Aminicenantes bacterium]|nr:RidA family protein [Candidatus Aminicenantes bacterium]